MTEMRRKRQALSEEACREIISRHTSGVLALSGNDGYPYAVPLSYAYREGTFWFHGAAAGHKIDAIRRCGKASFCVIDRDEVVPEKFTTYFRSVIAFGTIKIVEDEAEKRLALEALAVKYGPADGTGREEEIAKTIGRVCILALTVTHMSGKEAIELVSRRQREN